MVKRKGATGASMNRETRYSNLIIDNAWFNGFCLICKTSINVGDKVSPNPSLTKMSLVHTSCALKGEKLGKKEKTKRSTPAQTKRN